MGETPAPNEIISQNSETQLRLFSPDIWNITEFTLGEKTYYLGRRSPRVPYEVSGADKTELVLLDAAGSILPIFDGAIPASKDLIQYEDPRAINVDISAEDLMAFGIQGPIAAIGVTAVSRPSSRQRGEKVDWHPAILFLGKDDHGNVATKYVLDFRQIHHGKNVTIHAIGCEEMQNARGEKVKRLVIDFDSRNGRSHTFYQYKAMVAGSGSLADPSWGQFGQIEYPHTSWNEALAGNGGGFAFFNQDNGHGLGLFHGQIEFDMGKNEKGREYAIGTGRIQDGKLSLYENPEIVWNDLRFPQAVNGIPLVDHRDGIRAVYVCDRGKIVVDKKGKLCLEALVSRADQATFLYRRPLTEDEIDFLGRQALEHAAVPSRITESSSDTIAA